MTSVHFIGGEEGGVGKSLAARVLAQYMIDRAMPFIGFDTDRSHGALIPRQRFQPARTIGRTGRAERLGAKVIGLKRLHEGIINRIDAGSSNFWKAKTAADPSSGLGLMDRQRVKMRLRDAYREIDDVGI